MFCFCHFIFHLLRRKAILQSLLQKIVQPDYQSEHYRNMMRSIDRIYESNKVSPIRIEHKSFAKISPNEEKNTGFHLFFVTARVLGDAAGMQVPRYVGFVHGEDLLDAAAEFPSGRR